jgi:hypothetical protein
MFRDGSLLQAATMCELGSILLGGASLVSQSRFTGCFKTSTLYLICKFLPEPW